MLDSICILINIEKKSPLEKRCYQNENFEGQNRYANYKQLLNNSNNVFESIGEMTIREYRDPHVLFSILSENKFVFGEDMTRKIVVGLFLAVSSIIPVLIALSFILFILFMCAMKNIKQNKPFYDPKDFIKEYNLVSYFMTSQHHHHKIQEEIKEEAELLATDLSTGTDTEKENLLDDYDQGLMHDHNDDMGMEDSFKIDEFVLNDEKN
jgi:hypothetical protein